MATDNEPMSDERLAEIRSRYLTPVEIMRDTLSVPHAYEVDISRLLAEVDRLRAELTEARMKAAAEIHEEGHRLLTHDRKATLHQLLSFIERRYGKDLLATYWSE